MTKKWMAAHLSKGVIIFITLTLLLITTSCFNRKKSAPQSGSSALPDAFQTILPADGAINVDVFSAPVPVAWNGSSNATSYILEVAKEDDFAPVNMLYSATLGPNTTNHSVTYGLLSGGVWYYWRVTAVNANGTTVSSDAPSCFYTSSGGIIPGAFNLAAPIDNDSGLVLTPELDWTNAPKESKYIVYLDNDSNFSSPIYTDTTRPGELGIQIPIGAGLTETSRYYWKVDAINYFGNRQSSIYSFVTGPIKYYTITPTAATITAGQGVTMTITAYNSNNEIVSSHIPFTMTMNSGTGLTYYTDNTLSTINSTGTYAMTNGTARVYLKITVAGSIAITATDRAGRTKSCDPITVNAGPVILVTVSGQSSIASGVESSSYAAASYDAYNNTVADTYTWSKANGTGTATQNIDKLTGILAGTVTITATSNAAPTISMGKTVTVVQGGVATITVSGPDPITSGIQSSSYTAVSRDFNNNIISDTYIWSNSNGTGTATRSVDKLTGVLAGTVTITATSVSAPAKSGGKIVTVASGAITTVTVSGSDPITSGIQSSSYTAVSRDAAGNIVADTFAWSKANGTGSANLVADRLTGVISGTVTITATSVAAPTKSGGKTVTVIPGAVNAVTVAGPDPITSAVESSSYTAVSRDINNNIVSDAYTWSHSNGTGTATRNVDKLTGVISGTVTITATSMAAPSKSGGKLVQIVPGVVNMVTVAGSDPITSGIQSLSYIAVSRDINNNTVLDTYTWTKADGSGTANLSGDKLTGILVGTVTITATSNSAPAKSGGKTVTVVQGNIATVTVSGSDPITSGIQSSSYTAVSRDINNNLVSDTFTWSKANGTGSANLSVDKLTGVISGTVTITATSVVAPAKSGGKTVTVIPGAIVSITVSGNANIVSGLESNPYIALSKDVAGNIAADTYTWTNANGTGTATRNVDKLTGITVGTVFITATSNAVPTLSVGKTITVVPGTAVATVEVFGSDPITSGVQSASYTAASKDAAGNIISDSYTWTKANGTGSATLTVDKLTGVISGTVTITATSVAAPTKSGGKTVTVIPGAVNTVTVAGSDPITSGVESLSYTAVSRDINNNITSDTYNWTKANGTGTAAINGAQLTGALAGTVTITATSVSVPTKSGGKMVTVIPGAVNTVIVSGQDPIASGVESSSYSAVSYDAAGNIVVTDAHTWSEANGTGTATLNSAKLTGVISGTVTITATSVAAPTKSGGKTVTVIPGAVNTVTVAGPDPITSGVESSSYTAVSRDINNNIVSDTYNWTKANNTGSANLSVDKLTGVLSGTVAITATSVVAPSKSGGKTVTVVPGAVNTVTVAGPDPITSGVESSSYTAVSRDINNNIVSDTYNWTKANNTGSANLSVDKLTGVLSGTVTITATSVSAPAKSGGKTVTVVPGAIAAYSVIPASYSAVTGTNQTVTVTARDANGNTVDYDSSTVITTTITAVTATPTVTFYTNSSYTVTTTTYTLSGGSATVYYRAVYDGTPPQGFTITAQDNNSNQGTSNTVTIPISGPATKLVFTAPPTSVGAGSSFIPTVQVSVQDDYNNIVPAAANTITLTVSAGAVLGVITQTNAVSGIAIFTGLTAGGISATGYTLTATSAGLTSTTSTVFAITPGVANNLAFIAPPQIITAGNTWASLTVRVRDVYTNPVSGTSVSITSTNGTLINGTLIQVSAADGLATFSGLSMTLAANNYVLSATAGALSTTSSAFNITPAAPNTLAFIQQPGTTTAGASITPSVAVEVRDQYNNLVPSVDVSITATNGTLINGALTVASDLSGIATFSPISITLAATGYALSASVPTLNAIRSTDFDIIPASANRLAFIVQPTNTTVGNGFTPSVSVTVQDAYGNTRADAVNAITITGTGGLTFGGTNPRPAAGGIATFSDLTVGGISATGYTLTASAAGLVFATSTTFNLSGYGSAGALAFVQQPTDTRSGNPFSPVVTVRILDAYNNFVSNATNPVSITASSGATLGGAYTGVSAVAGIATFTGVTISGTANPYTLTATSAGLASAVSNSFNITSSNTGTGADNAWTISTAVNINVDTNGYGGRTAPDGVNWSITNNVASGQTTISSGIARPTGFAIGDEIIIINLKGISTTYTDVGLYEFRRITGLPTGSSITVDSNLTNAYDGSTQRIMVQRVPNYTDVTINTGGSLTCNVWNFTISDTGGVIAFRVSGTLTVNVANGINASAVGFAGGAGTAYNANAGAGESYNGTAGTGGTNTTDGNTGQGGGGGAGQDFAVARTGGAGGTGTGGGGGGGIQGFSTGTMFGGAGGGGGHGTIGTGTTGVSAYYGGYNGSDANGGAGGQGWGTGGFTEQGAGGGGGGGGIVGNSSTLNQRAYLGGGGGAGGGTLNGSQTANNTSGGRGGGIIFIGANAITVAASASITATGQTSNAATGGNSYRVPGGNGGGAGGSIIIIANTLINSGSIAADGGSGSSAGGYQGGAGGQGRTYIDINGTITTTPVSGSITFTYTGAEQQWVVPTGVTLIQVDVQGARGANGINSGATAGNGARVQTTLFVTPGQTLYIYAGGQGSGATGGFNGGGNSNGAGASTGGGGGGSDIRQSGTALANRIIVAGGGGGGGYDYGSLGYTGSAGAGGQNGGAGTWGGTNANGAGGGGGTQSGGGAGGGAGGNGQIGGAGALGTGGYGGYANGGANPGAGGGGGGYYGGGGGGGQAGGTGGGGAGGGSSWTSGTGSIYTTGYQTGNGLIIISY